SRRFRPNLRCGCVEAGVASSGVVRHCVAVFGQTEDRHTVAGYKQKPETIHTRRHPEARRQIARRDGGSRGDRASSCWTLLRDAAAGGEESRAAFAVRYTPVVRAYLAVRWRGSKLLRELDDTVQDVFLECLRNGGLLERVRADRPGGFRAFL